jgi:putative ABC transport system ATP-binding protein
MNNIDSNIIVKVNELSKHYEGGAGVVKALDHITVSFHKGEFAAIVGTSGSGKSTFLHMIGGLDYATSGEVRIGDKDIFSMKIKKLTEFRRKNIGFVFQSYNLVPVLNVYDNIILPVELDKQNIDFMYVEMLMETLGIAEKRYQMPNQLSGGQQQRVAIARALAIKPMIVLADEPTGNLDHSNTLQVMELLKITGRKLNQTIILITHNNEIAGMCDHIITLEDGKIINDCKKVDDRGYSNEA